MLKSVLPTEVQMAFSVYVGFLVITLFRVINFLDEFSCFSFSDLRLARVICFFFVLAWKLKAGQ